MPEHMDVELPRWLRVSVTSWASLLISLYLRDDEDDGLIQACEDAVWFWGAARWMR